MAVAQFGPQRTLENSNSGTESAKKSSRSMYSLYSELNATAKKGTRCHDTMLSGKEVGECLAVQSIEMAFIAASGGIVGTELLIRAV